jgi:hypothetical protein
MRVVGQWCKTPHVAFSSERGGGGGPKSPPSLESRVGVWWLAGKTFLYPVCHGVKTLVSRFEQGMVGVFPTRNECETGSGGVCGVRVVMCWWCRRAQLNSILIQIRSLPSGLKRPVKTSLTWAFAVLLNSWFNILLYGAPHFNFLPYVDYLHFASLLHHAKVVASSSVYI